MTALTDWPYSHSRQIYRTSISIYIQLTENASNGRAARNCSESGFAIAGTYTHGVNIRKIICWRNIGSDLLSRSNSFRVSWRKVITNLPPINHVDSSLLCRFVSIWLKSFRFQAVDENKFIAGKQMSVPMPIYKWQCEFKIWFDWIVDAWITHGAFAMSPFASALPIEMRLTGVCLFVCVFIRLAHTSVVGNYC